MTRIHHAARRRGGDVAAMRCVRTAENSADGIRYWAWYGTAATDRQYARARDVEHAAFPEWASVKGGPEWMK